MAQEVDAVFQYPFEFTKTRVQLQSEGGCPVPRNPFVIVGQTLRQEGFRALYKGCSSLVIGSVAKDGVRFLVFDSIKNVFADSETGTLTPANNLLAGMVTGITASVFAVTPTERMKTAMIDDARKAKRFKSTPQAVRTILQEDGFMGLYRGFVGTTLKQAGATAFRMGTYNILKDFQRSRQIEQNTWTNFVNGAVAGTVTTYGKTSA
ncbi:uncharacterized protein KY384_000597 [Bacidia gigantensis]|uniref:uncharacterized protein n=1 Tax=Bacidia gigantensis TaxID=2732470 RepID=UPI001D0375EE|nr:uncharacterized protein KY384_000597 [Bacidia gigantensis]KAG8525837.1 hypothetical protein KY384_000597 [Bacidia gigantensis]